MNDQPNDAAAPLPSAAPAGAVARSRLVCLADGPTYLVDAGQKRKVGPALLIHALESAFGLRHLATEAELDALPDGPPVEVMKAPQLPPFVVVGGRRMTLRGMPSLHGLSAADALTYAEGAALDLRPRLRPPACAELPPLPTFLIIGAQKSATRWLRTNLGMHPEVCVASTELAYFVHKKQFEALGPDGYRGMFGAWKGEPIVGEATPGYMMWRHHPGQIAARIHDTVPDVRLLAVLRNPIDRAYSAMVHHIERGRLPRDSDLLELVRATDPTKDPLALVSGGWYGASLAPYRERFGEQLLVLIHDDIAVDPRRIYEQACRHIGATTGFVPDELARVRHSQQPQNGPGDSRLTHEARVALFELFRDDVRRLERLIDRDLAQWDPSHRPGEGVVAAAPEPLGREA